MQDEYLYNLCRPERLLQLMYGFTLYDDGIKKVARYQQYFAVRQTMQRIRHIEGGRGAAASSGTRRGAASR